MKKIVTTLLVLINSGLLIGQDNYSKDLNGIDWVKIETKAEIMVKTHEKNELLIKVKEKEPIPERAKGLKLVGNGGSDNTNVGFNVTKSGNTLLVENIIKSQEAEIFLPKSQKLTVTNSWSGDIIIDGFSAEVEANANLNGGLVLKNLSGPITAFALNQDVTVEFDKISKDVPVVISTTNGAVDVTLPSSTAANLELSSWNGDVFTNFDLNRSEKNGLKLVSSKTVKGEINGGGTKISLKSTNGNIYLRKK